MGMIITIRGNQSTLVPGLLSMLQGKSHKWSSNLWFQNILSIFYVPFHSGVIGVGGVVSKVIKYIAYLRKSLR